MTNNNIFYSIWRIGDNWYWWIDRVGISLFYTLLVLFSVFIHSSFAANHVNYPSGSQPHVNNQPNTGRPSSNANVAVKLNIENTSAQRSARDNNVVAQHSNTPAENTKPSKDKKLVLAPMLISNPAFGDGGGVAAIYFLGAPNKGFRSRLIGQLLYSNADSYVGFGGAILHLNDDHQRVKALGINARVRNSFDDLVGGTAQYDTEIKMVIGEYLQKMVDNFYLGPKVTYKTSAYVATNDEALDYFERVNITDNDSVIVGAMAVYDTRDNDNFPYRGFYFNGIYSLSSEKFGGDDDYQFAELSLNHYHQLSNNHVLAFRHSGYFSFDAPYAGQAKLGNRNDLRGYTTGEIIAEHMFSNQVEYRWLTASRWSYVGFVGIAGLYSGAMTRLDDANWYKSIGVGFRYRLQDVQRVNFRLDFALGDDDNDGFYVSLREAF